MAFVMVTVIAIIGDGVAGGVRGAGCDGDGPGNDGDEELEHRPAQGQQAETQRNSSSPSGVLFRPVCIVLPVRRVHVKINSEILLVTVHEQNLHTNSCASVHCAAKSLYIRMSLAPALKKRNAVTLHTVLTSTPSQAGG